MSVGFEKLETVFRDATDPILIEDLSGIVLDVNDEAVRTYGLTREELIGQPIKTIVPADRHSQADELLAACCAGQVVRDVETVRMTKTGHRLEVLVSLSLLKDDDGQARGIATFAKEISQIKRAEEEIRQLNRVFRDAADPILLEDLEGVVFDLNSAAERLYGWSRDELIGRPIKKIIPSSSHGQADELLERCKAGEEVRNVEGLRVTKDGNELPVLITLSLLKDEAGQPTSVASFAKEITAQKQAQAELRELADHLEARVAERTAEIEQANRKLSHELAVARELTNVANREHEAVLLGDSIAVRSLRESINSFGRDDAPLLLVGPVGAGAEAVARALHCVSPRASRPFIFVDLASAGTADDSLFETRIDDSGTRIPGKAALADGGTLYLQGIEQLSPTAQASLRGLLSNITPTQTPAGPSLPDIRLVAYTSNDLQEEIRQGRFCSELGREVGRRRLAIPSLAERRDDILPIAKRIAHIRARSIGKMLDGLTDEACEKLLNYSWPGNIEELQNVIERAVILANGARLEVSSELLREGPKLGSYTLVRLLGSGAMGEVWLAQHALLARPAAVKLIRKQVLNVETEQQALVRARFQREARSTARLRSPNTVELYDFGISEDGSFYYVMEYLAGIDLQRLVEKFGRVSPSRAIHLIRQACLSLAEAHEVGLVHRDIKPANLFLCKLGTHFDFIKLLDFGIVRATSGYDQTTAGTGKIRGTPSCMSPEAARGQPATAASDVYSLGCVAYWLLTGQNVFTAPNAMSLLFKHVSEFPTPPSARIADLPRELDELVMQCLAKDPDARPSVNQLIRDLATIPLLEHWDDRLARAWWEANPELSSVESAAESETSYTELETMSLAQEHPSEATIRLWMDGELSRDQTEKLEEHLEDCERCAERLSELGRTLDSDEFINHVRDVMRVRDGETHQ